MNYWTSPACYPRGSFCLISHGHSTLHRGITKPDFRLCSARWPRSQAPLCLYTLRLVSIQPEGTFGRLRYLLGGDRPSQTTRLARSPSRFTAEVRVENFIRVVFQRCLPRAQQAQVLSLPPILRRYSPNPMPSCSKAPRGLFVLLRVIRIFTNTSISPGPSLRQCSSLLHLSCGSELTRQGISLP